MKINVIEVESKNALGTKTDGEIEIVKANNGLINVGGRTMPF